MAIGLNLCPNGYLVPPGGYPFALSMQVDSAMEAFLPGGVTTVNAIVCCVHGSCNAHAAIYTAPATSGGASGVLVLQADISNLVGTGKTLTLTMPTVTTPTKYVYRLWFDGASSATTAKTGFTGKFADTNAFGVLPASGVKNTSGIVSVLVGAVTVDIAPSIYISSASTVGSLSGGSLGTGI